MTTVCNIPHVLHLTSGDTALTTTSMTTVCKTLAVLHSSSSEIAMTTVCKIPQLLCLPSDDIAMTTVAYHWPPPPLQPGVATPIALQAPTLLPCRGLAHVVHRLTTRAETLSHNKSLSPRMSASTIRSIHGNTVHHYGNDVCSFKT